MLLVIHYDSEGTLRNGICDSMEEVMKYVAEVNEDAGISSFELYRVTSVGKLSIGGGHNV